MYALTQSVNNYLPRSRHLAGLIVVLIGSLLIRQLNIEMFMQHTSPSDL